MTDRIKIDPKTWVCGYCVSGNCNWCPGSISRPKDQSPMVCVCKHPLREKKTDG